jgi:hypothetical protein
MEVLELLKRALKTCASVIKLGAGIQGKVRKELTKDLQQICLKCEKAYETVLKRLSPVKDAFQDPKSLAKALRGFATDTKTRNAFKPEHLCGEIDHLITRLESNLDPLKYSIDVMRIQDLRKHLQSVGNYDAAIYQSYDGFARQLDELATQLQDSSFDIEERKHYAQHVIREFETDLRTAIDGVRDVKNSIIRGA